MERSKRFGVYFILESMEVGPSFRISDWLNATESAAVLDVCRKLNLIAAPSSDDNKALLERIAQMLTKLIKSRHPIE